MTDPRPEPLVPAEVDLRDFSFTPMYRARLFGSEFHANATDAEWRAGVTLWLKSWDQAPAGTLPTDDVSLCRLAELGRDLKTWNKIKARALHGWFECRDGRLHHKVVAEGVIEAWVRKLAQRDRTEKARAARLAKLQSQTENAQHEVSVTETVTDEKKRQNPSKGQGQGQGQGKKKETRADARSPAKGTRWFADVPETWLTDADIQRHEHDLPRIDLRLEAVRFKNYWSAKTGKGATKLDWHATWINWALDDSKRKISRVSAHDKGTEGAALFLESVERGNGSGHRNGAGTAGPSPRLLSSRHGLPEVGDAVPNLLRGPQGRER